MATTTTTTTTTAPTTAGELIGAERLDTPAKAKDAVKRTTRTAKKPAAPAKKTSAKKPAASGKGAHYFISCGRPAAGAALHAHTEAFFQIYSMHKAGGAPIATAQRVMGASAVNYHVSNARFEKRDGKVYLTPAGKNHFAARLGGIDGELVKAYISVMTTGKADGVAVKVQDNIAPVQAA